ncbi:glycosyltransferase [Polynucleobacter paneuropaeus]|jgi:undecaprenyl-phosphate 4-deoxy-4-formamido-L-arabinose transferase|uniref:Glycosyltransferase n=1 Tax=Polynucleobacter paneuropaeus TaxID=2527775 RepID=A0ABX9FED7_9BURK|nr:glycosyltransferase [Polynucleobacter paneuropaeus]MBT8522780.1 glycosyltransferase [Polynucleobacter paneuropaeus]MBT8557277.1 glycosyltransferase [Polynucleobacter paneuropaeus]MBT8584482.1 glycosyltransferase [Polynucleobacter paneuropaeus]MBT8594952.1 glycosyltransferase [Polynucleobacter paneuropaeus]MBT8608143.1 glycosyltransferase [Polynucleobacter paneuropaeus]
MTANIATPANKPQLSIVIPVYNEEDGLQALFDRLYPAMDSVAAKHQLSYEIIFVNDGSKDRSAGILSKQFELRPDQTRVLLFHSNFGQHMAIMAGFEYAGGDYIITLDADLQNPPEEIDALVVELLKGHDYVGTIRANRRDSFFRKFASRMMNRLRHSITHITMTDQGCMLRAYSRRIVDLVRQCDESNTFIPALAYTFAANPVEISVKHEERFAGESKYSLYQLIRLNFDLVTGFSVMPLQIFSILGMLLALAAGSLFVYLLVRRFLLGAEVEGVFTLFALTFFLIGVMLFGLGLVGEYIGRIYQQVRQRPRYVVKTVLEKK